MYNLGLDAPAPGSDNDFIERNLKILPCSNVTFPRPSGLIIVMDALTLPPNAYLIAGEKVQPLDKPIITIGRSLENQLVIDHPSVSRNHAQLRALNGHFVLFDLSSSAGTFINGQRISQAALYPGDVISIAEIALIYGQDNPPPRLDLNETIKVF